MIPVTKPYLPDREKLNKYIDGIYERNWLTNNGPLVQELTRRLEEFLGVENLLLVANGTLALQIAYHALDVKEAADIKSAEAITTPFTFIATASSLKWEGIKPVFADIDPETWCLDPNNIEPLITQNTRAVVPVHVFGNSCDVEAIDIIARKHHLKVIYDASHAFGVKYKGKSLLKHGDASTLSFHATKLFHTGEGGAIVFKRKEDFKRAEKMISFGMSEPDMIDEVGINAKMNELQAALGLCVLDEMDCNQSARRMAWDHYESELKGEVQLQEKTADLSYNFAYFPVVFETELQTTVVADNLRKNGILARRYFYPSLESIELMGAPSRKVVSYGIAKRILCLPIYNNLRKEDQNRVVRIVRESLRSSPHS